MRLAEKPVITGASVPSEPTITTPVVRPDSSVRRTAQIVGVLVLAGYLYGVGSLIAKGVVDSTDRSSSTALFVTGTALMLLNSAIVIGIGVLMFPILRPHNRAIAAGDLDPLWWTPDSGVRPGEGGRVGPSVEVPAGVPV